MSKLSVGLGAIVTLLAGFSIPASATTVSLAPAPAGYVNTSFDSGSLPSNWSASGPNAGVVTGSLLNQYTAPTGDSTPYAYVGMGSSITATFAGGITGLDILWGSPDSWNTITFNGPSGAESYSPGSGLLSILNPINTGAMSVLFTAAPGVDWTSVTFTSSAPAFEFDNVSTFAGTAPEPSTLALLSVGLLAIGTGAIRFRR